MTPLAELRAALQQAAGALRQGGAGEGPPPTLERPKKSEFGDFSTNAAMLLAPLLGDQPRTIAERLGGELQSILGDRVDRVEVAGPGFLNLFLADAWYRDALRGVIASADSFGGGFAGPGAERVLVEFVSTNPTGPLHVGHARNAAYGDAIARLLAFAGHDVQREYYVNDAGTQVLRFGESLQARARGEVPPEGGYVGDYVAELAAEIDAAAERPVDEVAREGIRLMLERIDASLRRFGVQPFDAWFSEASLHQGDPSAVDRVFARLEALGETYRSDGALWLRTSAHGDDKDRVLERSSGEHTYFASDIAYHLNKRERGFQRQIDVWGSDHHGHVQRVKSAFAALGADPDELELLIMQFVHLLAGARRASMSKRSGELVTLDDLIDEIGVDAARWFLLARSHDTPVDLDLDLARRQTNENPVYYVQYAHARIASVLAKAGEGRVAQALSALAQAPTDGDRLDSTERALILKLLAFPGEVEEAADRRAPHRIAVYALELAQDFTAFYRDCRVVGAEPPAVESFRLALSVAAQRTIAGALSLLGVGAPESM